MFLVDSKNNSYNLILVIINSSITIVNDELFMTIIDKSSLQKRIINIVIS